VVGHQLEVGVDRVVRIGVELIEEELHDALAGLDVQVEGAVDELEQAGAARMQVFHLGQEAVQPKGQAVLSSEDRQNSHLNGQPREAST
jgi:hypothetical protein